DDPAAPGAAHAPDLVDLAEHAPRRRALPGLQGHRTCPAGPALVLIWTPGPGRAAAAGAARRGVYLVRAPAGAAGPRCGRAPAPAGPGAGCRERGGGARGARGGARVCPALERRAQLPRVAAAAPRASGRRATPRGD